MFIIFYKGQESLYAAVDEKGDNDEIDDNSYDNYC